MKNSNAIDMKLLQAVRAKFLSADIFLLKNIIERFNQNPVFKGKKIVYNAHLTLISVVQIEALLAGGAEVIVTYSDLLQCDPEVLELLQAAHVTVVPLETLVNYPCTAALDCCAGLLGRVVPEYGIVELTRTGVLAYEQSNLHYPVISVDDAELKKLETYFGTGDGFVRAFRALTKQGLSYKKFAIFGYGKVGRGIAHALTALNAQVIIVEKIPELVSMAQKDGYTAYFIQEAKQHFNDLFAAVTATGIAGTVSQYFSPADFGHAYLVNMGSEDEWGDRFATTEILNHKIAINFDLKEPTAIIFLDPIFAAQIEALEQLTVKPFTVGVHSLSTEKDLALLLQWILRHYRLNIAGDYLENIISHIPSFIYWKDQSLVYQGCNQHFATAAGGQSVNDIIGKTDYELAWGKNEADLYRKDDQRVLAGESLLNFEETQTQENGKIATVLASKVPYRDEEGHVIGILGIYTDISERKKMEENLRISKQKAELANEAKTALLATMRHEFRTPLNGILGMTQILRDRNLSSEDQGFIDVIEQSGQNLLRLVNDILDLSLIESGSLVLQNHPFSIQTWLNDVITQIQPLLVKKHIVLTHSIDASIQKTFYGDSLRTAQILKNLVTHAISLTPQGKIDIHITAQPKTPNHYKLMMSVKDNGIGMSQEKIALLFNHSMASNPHYSHRFEDTNLDLVIALNLARLMGGNMEIFSELGKGTEFKAEIHCSIPDFLHH